MRRVMPFTNEDKIIIKHYRLEYKLNVLDYCLWSFVEATIHKHQRITDLEHLKREIVKTWDEVPQETVSKAINAFRKRVRAVIKADGGHIEHFL